MTDSPTATDDALFDNLTAVRGGTCSPADALDWLLSHYEVLDKATMRSVRVRGVGAAGEVFTDNIHGADGWRQHTDGSLSVYRGDAQVGSYSKVCWLAVVDTTHSEKDGDA